LYSENRQMRWRFFLVNTCSLVPLRYNFNLSLQILYDSGTIRLLSWLWLASMCAMRLAVEHVRRMRGGAQAHLMRCDDDGYYIVKFQNNPQHLRILANEMLATRLAARLGLCVPQVEVVEVRPELIAYTTDLVMQLGMGRIPCSAGKQFGSQFPGIRRA